MWLSWWKGPILGVVAFIVVVAAAAAAGCGDDEPAAVLEATEAPEPTPTATPQPTEAPTPTPLPTLAPIIPPPVQDEPGQACHPSYAGTCLDPNASDYDCLGGSGDGPLYTGPVQVVGPDVFGLDADNDGLGCE